jgi:hypothetical protein
VAQVRTSKLRRAGRQRRGGSCKIAEASTAMTFLPGTLTRAASAFIPPRAVGSLVGYSQISDQRPSLCLRQNSVRRRDGEDCKDSRPQKSDGYIEEHGLSQVRQAHADRQASERPRAERAGGSLYFLLRLRFLREAVSGVARRVSGLGRIRHNALGKKPKSRFLGVKPARNDKDEEGRLSAYILLARRPSDGKCIGPSLRSG